MERGTAVTAIGPPRTPRGDYVPGVHAARALAIVMVLAAHFVGLWTNSEQFHWLPWDLYLGAISRLRVDHQAGGHTGLLLFFIVSGYIVSQAATRDGVVEFLVKRAARILPAMIIAVAATLAVATLARNVGWPPVEGFVPERAYSPWAFVEALGLTPVFAGTAILFPLWTLAVEIYWYLMLAASFGLAMRWPAAATVVIAAALLLFLAWGQPLFGVLGFSGYSYVFVILIGRWIYLWTSGRSRLQAAAVGAACMVALYALSVWLGEGLTAVSLLRITAVGWAVLLFLALLRFVRRGPWPPVGFVADISYGLYLFHVPAMWLVLPLVSPGGRHFEFGLGLTVALTVLAAWASHRFVEVPIRRAARAWLSRSGAESGADAHLKAPAS